MGAGREGQQRKERKDKNRNKSRRQLEGNEDRGTCSSAGDEESPLLIFQLLIDALV